MQLCETTMRYIFLFLFSFSFAQQSQTVDSLDNKFLTALLYLKTNKDINQKLVGFHNKWISGKKLKKNQIVNFNLSEYVTYLPLPDIDIEVDQLVNNGQDKFESEHHKLFKNLIPKNSSKIYLIFSKPQSNYLVAEFVINLTNNEIDLVDNKTGPAIHLFFLFDENNCVDKVFTSSSYYN